MLQTLRGNHTGSVMSTPSDLDPLWTYGACHASVTNSYRSHGPAKPFFPRYIGSQSGPLKTARWTPPSPEEKQGVNENSEKVSAGLLLGAHVCSSGCGNPVLGLPLGGECLKDRDGRSTGLDPTRTSPPPGGGEVESCSSSVQAGRQAEHQAGRNVRWHTAIEQLLRTVSTKCRPTARRARWKAQAVIGSRRRGGFDGRRQGDAPTTVDQEQLQR